jgi:hypothetical protein
MPVFTEYYSDEDYKKLDEYWAAQKSQQIYDIKTKTYSPYRPEVKRSSHKKKHEYRIDDLGRIQGDAIMYASDGQIGFHVRYENDEPVENMNPHGGGIFEHDGKRCVCYGSSSWGFSPILFDYDAPFIKETISATGCCFAVI